MPNCPFCGTDLPPSARFCGNCGRSQPSGGSGVSGEVVVAPPVVSSPAAPSQPQSLPPTSLSGSVQPVQAPVTPPVPPFAGQSQPVTPISGPFAPVQPQPAPPAYPAPAEVWQQSGPDFIPPAWPAFPTNASGPVPGNVPVVQGAAPTGSIPVVQGAPPPQFSGPMHALAPAPQATGSIGAGAVAGAAHKSWIATTAGKIITIVVAAVVVVGGGVAAFATYQLTRPQPKISANSPYKLGSTLAGTIGTSIHINGQDFSGTSAITFLLDGHPAPGGPHVQSDNKGNVSADLPITAAWSLGKHTLTAKDAGNYATKQGVAVMIVPQGQANTPGPNNSPPDDGNFTLNVNVQGGSSPLSSSSQLVLYVTGQPDPAGGKVCGKSDDGVPHSFDGQFTSGSLSGATYHDTIATTCTGSYKAGKITYTQKATQFTRVIKFQGISFTCKLPTPFTQLQLTGSFSDQNTASGTFNSPAVGQHQCSGPAGAPYIITIWKEAGQGSWTGTKGS